MCSRKGKRRQDTSESGGRRMRGNSSKTLHKRQSRVLTKRNINEDRLNCLHSFLPPGSWASRDKLKQSAFYQLRRKRRVNTVRRSLRAQTGRQKHLFKWCFDTRHDNRLIETVDSADQLLSNKPFHILSFCCCCCRSYCRVETLL